MEIKLRDYQQDAFNAVLDHFKSSAGNKPALVDMSVGSGKTALAAFLAQHTASKGGSVMLIARQSELVMQSGEFMQSIGVKVSYYSNGLGSKSVTHSVICGTEGTIVRALDGAFAKWAPSLILVDECHMTNHEEESTMMMRILLHFQAINPKARILGLTGSPFRGTDSIIGDFWTKCLYQISTEFLVSEGWLTGPVFGWPEHNEDTFDFDQLEQKYGTHEFTDAQMDEFRNGDPTLTHRIMAEVVHRTSDDLGVLIFAQTKKHCKEVADALPPGSWGIITDDSTDAERADVFVKAKTGEIKYTINVGVCSTGWDCPYWQTIVYLRRVGSLVFFIQSMGRAFRLFIESGADMGSLSREDRLLEIAASRKPVAKILDFAGGVEKLIAIYENDFLNQAQLEKAKREGSTLDCPRCSTVNSDKARRCIGVGSSGIRCDYFWINQSCRKCGAENDVTARDCRVCGEQLLDPNAKLLNKAYTDSEMVPVERMDIEPTKNGGILVRFVLDCEKPEHGWPVEFYAPGGSPTAHRVWYNNFVKLHVRGSQFQSKVYMMKSAPAIMKMKAMFDKPTHIAYRLNPKGKFVIGRRRFASGRTVDEKGAEQ